MAHESFEDSTTADIMNENFVNIKIDREERPDIDQIYMDAVQKMGLNGGWPLNVFLTPDQKPFYGGAYFPRDNWQKLLLKVVQIFKENREEIELSADQITDAIDANEVDKFQLNGKYFRFSEDSANSMINKFSKQFDNNWGGLKEVPKFPMPSIWNMLLTHYSRTNDQRVLDHLMLTLNSMANGGIYDQIGGGFARYSIDAEWHVPHFEKMLYDNGQLLSLYAKAYKVSQSQKFEEVILETTEWLRREMLHESGGFYSALDADSEGVEGEYYVWTNQEIERIATEDNKIIQKYFDVSQRETGRKVTYYA